MQRQSIGSPGTKLYSHGEAKKEEEKNLEEEQQKRRSGGGTYTTAAADEEEKKFEKQNRSTISRPEKFIHLIPILTLFCLLVLYLCSYDPSQKDLGHFKDIQRPSKLTDLSSDISDLGKFLRLEKSDVLAIRSHRSLQELGKQARKSRFHRKIGDF